MNSPAGQVIRQLHCADNLEVLRGVPSGRVGVAETTTPRDHARNLATRALNAAMRGEWASAAAIVRRMNAECGSDGTMHAVFGWCDTLISRLGLDVEDGQLALGFVDRDTGTVSMSTGVPQRTQWAGQLIMARARLDEPMFTALLNALPKDPAVVGSYVGAVLECVAITLKEHADG